MYLNHHTRGFSLDICGTVACPGQCHSGALPSGKIAAVHPQMDPFDVHREVLRSGDARPIPFSPISVSSRLLKAPRSASSPQASTAAQKRSSLPSQPRPLHSKRRAAKQRCCRMLSRSKIVYSRIVSLGLGHGKALN